MSIIQRYITREIIKQFSIVLIAVVSIYIIVDFFEKSDDFVKAGLPAGRTLTFFLLNVPFIVSQIAPIGILLSIIVVFSLMNKNNELLALKSGGVSFYSLLRPVLILGAAASVGLFFFSDQVVPETTTKANRIWLKEVKNETLMSSKEENIWIKGNRRITHITYYNPVQKRIFGISINIFNDKFQLITKIDADKGVFQKDLWHLSELIEQKLDKKTGAFAISYFENKFVDLDFVPDDLAEVVRKPEEMSYTELREYIHKVEDEGYDATIHRVNLHAKPAFAFVCVIMCLMGMGLAVRKGRNQGVFFSIAYGIALAFFYWIFYSFCLSLGYGEMLPPVAAAWVSNLIFLCLGFLILAYAE